MNDADNIGRGIASCVIEVAKSNRPYSRLGAIVPGSLLKGLYLMSLQAFYQLLETGIIIIAAMLIDGATRKNA